VQPAVINVVTDIEVTKLATAADTGAADTGRPDTGTSGPPTRRQVRQGARGQPDILDSR
jgi:hypothetical protein